MKLISHRINTIEQLCRVPKEYGVEVDIRSCGGDLVIHHDPFVMGENFEEWIKYFQHNFLILNVKEEGLENRLLSIMKKFDIDNFFFLDQSFPFLVKWAGLGEKRCAARVSEFESIETALALAGMIEWIWVDCFTKLPISYDDYIRLRGAGFKLCLVSPELQGRNPELEIPRLISQLSELNIVADAVCTKRPDLWKSSID